LARLDPHVLARTAEAVVRAELRDGELADRDLLAVRVEALDETRAVDRDAGEVTRGVAVLRLRRNRRSRGELRRAVEARPALDDRLAEVQGNRLSAGRAVEGDGDRGRRGDVVERAVGRERERAGADLHVRARGGRVDVVAADDGVVVVCVRRGLAEVDVHRV